MKSEGARRCLCVACGWSGRRKQQATGAPKACPVCASLNVVVAGSPLPLPRDPEAIARALNADPWLLWRVCRNVQTLRVVGPWTPFGGYWERMELDGTRVAWVRDSGVGMFEWETRRERGCSKASMEAMAAADAALQLESDRLRLVGRGSRP